MSSTGVDGAVARDVDMHKRPGHLIRRVHQLHGALWSAEVSKDVTPTQFSVLTVIAQNPGCDQATVSREASLDSSTAGSVVYRLIKRRWVRVDSDPADRRRNLLTLTEAGRELFEDVSARAARMTDRLVASLDEDEREQLVALLERIIDAEIGD